MILQPKIYFIPPRLLTNDILSFEFDTTAKLVYDIESKYTDGKSVRSVLMRRFFRYQPYAFLRNRIIGAELAYRGHPKGIELNKKIVKFGLAYYTPNNLLIQTQCEEIFDYWQITGNDEKVADLSSVTTLEIHNELQFLFTTYKQKYGL